MSKIVLLVPISKIVDKLQIVNRFFEVNYWKLEKTGFFQVDINSILT